MSAENLAVFNRNALVNNTTFTVKDAKGDVVARLNGAKAATLVATLPLTFKYLTTTLNTAFVSLSGI